jgi:hypothetical protein
MDEIQALATTTSSHISVLKALLEGIHQQKLPIIDIVKHGLIQRLLISTTGLSADDKVMCLLLDSLFYLYGIILILTCREYR